MDLETLKHSLNKAIEKLNVIDINKYQITDIHANNIALVDIVFSKGILKSDLEITTGIITYEIYPFWSISNYTIGINEDQKLSIQFELKYN